MGAAWALLLLAFGCLQTVLRPGEGGSEPVAGGVREPARTWRIGGLYDAAHVVDPRARPLQARLAVGESRPLWLHPEQAHWGGEPRVRWVSTHPEVASVSRAGGQLGAELRGRAPGETEVYAIVRVHGGVRAELAYYCCGDCREAALPRCTEIPIDRVVVTGP